MNLFKFKLASILLASQIFLVSVYGLSAKFTYNKLSNCAPAVVEFTNTSTSGAGITYKWNFGLGAIVTTTDNSIKKQLYSMAGQYKVTLVVTDGTTSDSTTTIITIAQGPTAKIAAAPVGGCKPLLVTFTSNSVSGDSPITNTTWDLRNGKYLTGTLVQNAYQKTGNYTVALKVTDSNGCSSYLETDSIIKVVDKPKVNFIARDTFGCVPPLNVSYTNLSTGSSALTYKWNFGNGQTSTEISNSTVYNLAGSYNVTLKATDKYGCSDSVTKKAFINIGSPKGELQIYNLKNEPVTRSILCSGFYRFAFSLNNIPNYTWDIIEGKKVTTITDSSSIWYYVQDTGKLEINLTYGKKGLCTDHIQKIFTKSSVTADFTVDTALVCSLPRKVNLVNKSKNAVAYSWYFNGEVISNKADTAYTITSKDVQINTFKKVYSHVVDTTFVAFILMATNKDGCSDFAIRTTPLSFPVARFVPDKVSGCAPLQVSFSDSSKSAFKIDGYTYKFGSETITTSAKIPVIYQFNNPGEYYISEIINSKGCRDTSYAVKIVVGEKLTPDFTISPAEVCNGEKIQIAASSNNNTLVNLWHVKSNNVFNYSFKTKPDTSITINSDTAGIKDVSLEVDYNGCLSKVTKTGAYKVIGPAGNFEETFSCDSSLIYRFKSKILPATSITWNIDTATFTGKDSIRYKFPKSGDYTAKLTVVDNASHCVLTKTKLLNVRQAKANFILKDTIFCVGDTVLLDAVPSKDYINTCYNEGFLWDFGDDSPPRRTFKNTFDHVYSSKGRYKLNLMVKADNGCIDSAKRYVHIFRPEGSFITDKKYGCLPDLDVKFTNTSTDTTVVRWEWNFGDNKSDNTSVKQISHKYTSNEQTTFNSWLTVFDIHQCKSASFIPITLIGVPSDFQADDNALCLGQTATLTPVDNKLDSVLWNFGDGNSSKTKNSNTYTNTGQYTITLKAYKNGCSGTTTKNNYITVEKADANFKVNDSVFNCYPETLAIQHLNQASPVIERIWTLDSKDLADNAGTVNYIFTRPASSKMKLMVRTLNGCTASASKNIVVNGPTGGASFSPNKICYNGTVNFKIDSMNNVSSFKWLFGDGNSATTAPVSHQYTAQGYIVPAIQFINGNCIVSKTLDTLFVSHKELQFNRVPLADTSINLGDSVRLNIITDNKDLVYSWSPNDKISCLSCANPVVGPYNDLTYKVTMKDNCIESSQDFNVKVVFNYFLEPPAAFTPNGDSHNDVLKFEQRNIQNFELKIFNRWGKIVFSTNDINEGWDGTTNGKLQNIDTYTYFVKAETITGHKFEKKGSFLLLK